MTEELTQIAAPSKNRQIPTAFFYVAALLATATLFLLSRSNYLLFHSLVELSSIVVAITLFSIGWNTRKITNNEPLTLLAISFLVIGSIDLLHTLSYKGMGVFPDAGVDPPTQFWIAARFLESISYLLAALLLRRKLRLNVAVAITTYITVGLVLALSIWPMRLFPSCFIEGQGLTPFKVTAEYVVCFVLALSGGLFWNSRGLMPNPLLRLLLWSIALTIASEMAFTLYSDVYGITNVIGHILKFSSVILVYRALALGALQDPFNTLFRELTTSNQTLDTELAQRRRTEEELRHANQELDTFVRTVSHDLRSPLTVITGGAEFLKMELNGQLVKEHLGLLDNISTQGHHMAELLNNLLSLASVGRIETNPETIQLGLIAAHVVDDLGPEIYAAGCSVEVREMPEMLAHPTLIYQLFSNLIGNAIRYGANPEKPITIEGERVGRALHLYVADHGKGIPEQERELIFNVFYRGADTIQKPGTGIGLASAKKIAQFYNGQIIAEETPGGGATFRVILTDPRALRADNESEVSAA